MKPPLLDPHKNHKGDQNHSKSWVSLEEIKLSKLLGAKRGVIPEPARKKRRSLSMFVSNNCSKRISLHLKYILKAVQLLRQVNTLRTPLPTNKIGTKYYASKGRSWHRYPIISIFSFLLWYLYLDVQSLSVIGLIKDPLKTEIISLEEISLCICKYSVFSSPCICTCSDLEE